MEETKFCYPLVPLRNVVVFPGETVYLEVARESAQKAISKAMSQKEKIIVSAQKDPQKEEPSLDDLFETGILAEVKQVVHVSKENILRVVIVGKERVCLEYVESKEDYMEATAHAFPKEEPVTYSLEVIAMVRGLKDIFRVYGDLCKKINAKVMEQIMEVTDLDTLIYKICANIPVNYLLKQKILQGETVTKRHEELAVLLNREIGIMRIQEDIAYEVKKQVEENQKEYYLREELKAIHKELGDQDVISEADRYREKAEKRKLPKYVKKKILEESNRLRKIQSNTSESGVIRGYLDTLVTFPWKKKTKEQIDINYAIEVLNKNHYGLEKIKERITEYLAVKMLKEDGKSPIICLVGPPGTGKTSIAKSIAHAINRKYVRVCLGGVRDEAEIRGHRRTYVGAMPGKIVAGLRSAKVANPLMLLDEIDKMANDQKGDPSSALLEVLDLEQNKRFRDHYMEIPINLSKVMFICTANTTSTIPRPLLDRMEVISLSGYTENEKFHIAKEYLLPKQKKENGVDSKNFHVSDKVLLNIIRYYTREAGVRGLEREIGALCRKGAKEIALQESQVVRISLRNQKKYLGNPRYTMNPANEEAQIGIVRGLAWTAVGGDTLEIEVNVVDGEGRLELTGKLGKVMQESAKIALNYVRSTRIISNEYYKTHDFHLHVPEGAVPKDGPSAGVTMATAFYSAFSGKKVRPDVAMTGEITLRGKVLAIGGLKEKLLAAKAAGITDVFVPKKNSRDIEEMEEEVLKDISIHYADVVEDIWKKVLL